MGNFLKWAFSSFPQVVGDTRALIAYVVACVAWVIVCLKVVRNKNLLRSLEKLPRQERLEALRMEMGAIPVAKGVTPEQFLRARVHRFYFLAFVTLCALIAVLAVIAHQHPTAVTRSEITSGFQDALARDREAQVADQETEHIQEVTKKIEAIAIHEVPEYYKQAFGEPAVRDQSRNGLRLIWKDDYFWLAVVFIDNSSIGYALTSRDVRFRPHIPFDDTSAPTQVPRLGEATLGYLLNSVTDAVIAAHFSEISGPYTQYTNHKGRGFIGYSSSGVTYPVPLSSSTSQTLSNETGDESDLVKTMISQSSSDVFNSFAFYDYTIENLPNCNEPPSDGEISSEVLDNRKVCRWIVYTITDEDAV